MHSIRTWSGMLHMPCIANGVGSHRHIIFYWLWRHSHPHNGKTATVSKFSIFGLLWGIKRNIINHVLVVAATAMRLLCSHPIRLRSPPIVAFTRCLNTAHKPAGKLMKTSASTKANRMFTHCTRYTRWFGGARARKHPPTHTHAHSETPHPQTAQSPQQTPLSSWHSFETVGFEISIAIK